MTNREKLMEELAALDNASFDHVVLSRMSDLPEALQGYTCQDCRAEHGGECPGSGDGSPCALSLVDWFDRPCTHDRLITEEALAR